MARRKVFILLTALYVCAVYAWADTEADSLYQDYFIDEVEVTARSLTKDIILPQTLKGEELQRMNALSVADALRYFSGVQLKDYGGVGGIKTINVRSMGSQHTAVYYNGIQLGNDARVSVFAGPALTFAVKGNTHTSENVLNTSNDLNWYGENSNNQQLDLMGAAGVAFQFKTIRLFGGYRMGFLDLDKRNNVKTTNSGMFVGLSYAL